MLEFTLSEDKNYYIVTGCDKDATSAIIPAEYNGLPVAEIGERAFYERGALTNVAIPNTIKNIGDCAFTYCFGLKSIVIPDGVKTIGYATFSECYSLEEIVIPDSVTSIGNSAFANDGALKSITIPKGIKCINYGVFRGCECLKSIEIPDGVTSIDEDAFSNCAELTDIKIPNTVTEIGERAFEDCPLLTDIVIPNTVTKIGTWAFSGCNNLNSITLPFVGDSLTDASYTHLGHVFGGYRENSFCVPESLKYVTITGGRMEKDSLAGCSTLTHVIIGDGVEYIKQGALGFCRNLEEVTLPFVGESLDKSGETHIGHAFSEGKYSVSSLPESLKHLTITGGEIKKDNFKGCSITSITIGDGIKSISEGAFAGASLEKLTLPFVGGKRGSENISYFGCIFGSERTRIKKLVSDNYLVYNVFVPKSLKTVEIIGGNIGDYAFSHCENITEIIVGDKVTNIGKSAFVNCVNLTSLTLPSVSAHVGDLFGASNYNFNAQFVPQLLKTVVIKGGTSICNEAFYHCDGLESITIPSTVTSIGYDAFSFCNNLKTVNYTGTIDEWAQIDFDSYNANPLFDIANLYVNGKLVTDVALETATKISKFAFHNCRSVNSVVIGDNVTSIGDSAFANCEGLKKVIIGDSVTSIDDSAFSKCYGLESITIPPNVQGIGANAFSDCHLKSIEFVNYVGWRVEVPRQGKKPKVIKIDKKLLMDTAKSIELLTQYSNAKWVNTLDLSKMKKF